MVVLLPEIYIRQIGIMRSKGPRLMIVAFDCDDIVGQLRILPSIKEIDDGDMVPSYFR